MTVAPMNNPFACYGSVKHCESPPHVIGATRSMEGTSYASRVTYVCMSGRYLQDQAVARQVIQCHADATWSAQPQHCKGEMNNTEY